MARMGPRHKITLGAIAVAAAAIAAYVVLGYYGQHAAAVASIANNPLPARQTAGTVVFGVDGVPMNYSRMVQAKSYGIGWTRSDIRLSPSFAAYMRNLSLSGTNVVGILDYDTVGAMINSNGCFSNCTWNMGAWNSSVHAAVSEYPQVHVWEIWNEPQIPKYQDGALNSSPYSYYLLLRAAYGIIKAHNASDTVLCLGGDNPYSGGLGADPYDYQWAQALWAYGAAEYCDAVSLHVYSAFTYLMSQTPSYQGIYGNQTIGEILNSSLAQYENLTGKPIWITEVGIPSGNNQSYGNLLNDTPQKQAEFVNQTFTALLSKPYVRAIFWYHMYGYSSPPYNIDFGLFTPGMAPKPAYYAFRSFAAQQG